MSEFTLCEPYRGWSVYWDGKNLHYLAICGDKYCEAESRVAIEREIDRLLAGL